MFITSKSQNHLPQGVICHREFFLATVALGLLLWGFRPGMSIKRIVTTAVKYAIQIKLD
uniref:Uncharacterized protein n=1 Tax=Anguilla anguilla TaxID=7936 RepID=A0A0E9SHM2_ANGAN